MNISSFPKVFAQNWLKRLIARADIVLGVFVVLLGFFLANFLYKKQQQRLKGIEDEIAQEEQKTGLAKELSALDGKLKAITAPYLKKDTSFSIDKFGELATAAGVKIASLSVENEVDSGLYTVTTYRLAVRAGYHSAGKFISALEAAADMVKVEEISLAGGGAQAMARHPGEVDSVNIINVSMRVSVSFIKNSLK